MPSATDHRLTPKECSGGGAGSGCSSNNSVNSIDIFQELSHANDHSKYFTLMISYIRLSSPKTGHLSHP